MGTKGLPTRRRVKRRKSVTQGVLGTNPGIPANWSRYFQNRRLAEMQWWLDLVNDPPTGSGPYNFEIRNYRMLEPEDRDAIVARISSIVASVAHNNPTGPAGIDYFDHSPLRLFLAVLDASDLGRLRACKVCSRYFYANRWNKRVCSTKCGTTARVRRHRDKQSAYEMNRKQAQAAKEREEERWKREVRKNLKERE
jgi:hypothetical protein